ncbi:MAG TPA: hypothetical protein VF670_13875 [Duganella sp.]|jgi:hypothetical protein
MFTTMSAQLSTPTLLRLIEHLRMRSESKDISEALNTALEFWLDAQNELPAGADPAGIHGYQWKSLFLPEGTILRSWSYGEHNYARVEGDRIIHEGESVSPNQFARSFTRTARNAWFDLSVRRPGDKQFKMASLLRQELTSIASVPNASAAPVALIAAPVVSTPPVINSTNELAPANPLPPTANTAPRESVQKADFDPGWNLPERRKFRYRLEDIAY